MPRLSRPPALRTALALAAVALTALGVRAQVCEGDVRLVAQVEVDAFDCTEVTGNLIIGPGWGIANLDSLASLDTVGGDLRIEENLVLANVDGLTALTAIGGGLRIKENHGLRDVDGLPKLSVVGRDLVIDDNDALTDLDGLTGLVSIGRNLRVSLNGSLVDLDGLAALTALGGSVFIEANPELTDLDGLAALAALPGLEHWGSLTIFGNDALAHLDGLGALTSVSGAVSIRANGSLADIGGLASLTSVGAYLSISYNGMLTDLDGLAGLASIGGGLYVYENEHLTSCTVGLGPLLTSGGVGGDVEIHTNAPGCNSVCEVIGACPANEDETPLVTGLAPVHPNPARGAATLTYTLAEPGAVVLAVYDGLGRRVAVLAEGERGAGVREAALPAGLPAGAYVVRLAVGGEAWTQRVTLVR